MTGSQSQLVFKPLPADDPKQRQPDITLARKKLNWAPKIELREGLQRTISYFRSILAGEAEGGQHVPTALEITERLPIQPEEMALS